MALCTCYTDESDARGIGWRLQAHSFSLRSNATAEKQQPAEAGCCFFQAKLDS